MIEEDARVWESGEELHGRGEIQLANGVEHQMIYTKRLFVGPGGKLTGIRLVHRCDRTGTGAVRGPGGPDPTYPDHRQHAGPGFTSTIGWGRAMGTSSTPPRVSREIVGYEDEPVQTASTGATILGLAGRPIRTSLTLSRSMPGP